MTELIIPTNEFDAWRDFELTFNFFEEPCVHIKDGKCKWSGYKFINQSWGDVEPQTLSIECPRYVDYIKIEDDQVSGWCEGHFETLYHESSSVEQPMIPTMTPIRIEWTDDLARCPFLTFSVNDDKLTIKKGNTNMWSGYFILSSQCEDNTCTIDMGDSCLDDRDTIVSIHVSSKAVWFELEDGTYLRFPDE